MGWFLGTIAGNVLGAAAVIAALAIGLTALSALADRHDR